MMAIKKKFGVGFFEKINEGTILIFAAVVAIWLANSPFAQHYFEFWAETIVLKIGPLKSFSFHGQELTLLTFVNDALMTIFFLSVGLEIKREVLVGELSSIKKALFPIIAAIGGMLFPVGLYLLFASDPSIRIGAPISMATDIAFSLGVLSLFGKRVPISLKVFLTTLAVADDIGGIIVIATCFSNHMSLAFIGYAFVAWLVLLIGGQYYHIRNNLFYGVFGFIFWVLFVETGIHPTIAGVLIAITIPARPSKKVGVYLKEIQETINKFPRRNISEKKKIILSSDQIVALKHIEAASDRVISPLQNMEDALKGLVHYVIMPTFALANAGVILGNVTFATLFSGVTLAVMVSLIFGKFIGIFSFSYLFEKMKVCHKPDDIEWKHIAGVAMLGGIGFTVALFIANLSFSNDLELLNQAKLGIVIGSLLSGVIGVMILNKVLPKQA